MSSYLTDFMEDTADYFWPAQAVLLYKMEGVPCVRKGSSLKLCISIRGMSVLESRLHDLMH